MCFMIFTLIEMPLILIPPGQSSLLRSLAGPSCPCSADLPHAHAEKYRKPFLTTSITSTVTFFSMFIWSLARAHGGGPLLKAGASAIVGVKPATGSALGWAIIYGVSSQIGGICAGIANMSDYTR